MFLALERDQEQNIDNFVNAEVLYLYASYYPITVYIENPDNPNTNILYKGYSAESKQVGSRPRGRPATQKLRIAFINLLLLYNRYCFLINSILTQLKYPQRTAKVLSFRQEILSADSQK
ncbi:hypothetical protein N7481_005159 [Penicillium waksmanii]|uniref:uncharacterized protein n=1 Tax=Penicillium waksmanii TaxID=69791 RepID=UPI00254796F4|nr:uncharacterized protein N7481_005159 [Penicillium waksmanii]KAJ5983060.1 hypothetical protein N7481_005159 [Penicillium waksmanii]